MIIAVAHRAADGRVRSMAKPARHVDLLIWFRRDPAAWGGDRAWRDGQQGFIDDSGRFLTRVDAALHARGCNQLKRQIRGAQLFSEDVW